MIAPETTALILLAAGKSERFGLSDKLTAMFLGKPLGMHAVTALEAVPFARRIVVKDGGALDYASRWYELGQNLTPELGLSLSVRLGIAAARGEGIEAALIALADMPRITATHVHRLYEAVEGPDSVVASSDGVRPRPPVLFGAGRFDALERLEGDTGARDMILAGRHVVTTPDELIDVDTEEELEALLAKFGQARFT